MPGQFSDPYFRTTPGGSSSVGTAEIIDGSIAEVDLSPSLIDKFKTKVIAVAGLTSGQTAFALPSVPSFPQTLKMYVNGSVYCVIDATGAVALSGATVTWSPAGAGFSLSASDQVSFDYA